MYEDQSYCGEFALWVDIAQGFKVLIAGAHYFLPNRLLQVTSGARSPDLKFWGGHFLLVRGNLFGKAQKIFKSTPTASLLFRNNPP